MKKLALLAVVLLVSATSVYAQFTFTSIDFPGGNRTTVLGINNHGDIVGTYRVPHQQIHALLIQHGQFLPLAPTTVLGSNRSAARKINDRGDIVGDFTGDDGFVHGFLLRHGVLSILDFPGASDTYALGINESGTVVGMWDLLDSSGNVLAAHGLVWNNGNFTEVNFPGSAYTWAVGINARGDIVGVWDVDMNSPGHGLVFSRGRFTSFDVPFPGATATQADDINAAGHIVGLYTDADGVAHGFLAEGASFTSIDYPGAVQTVVWGINAAGQIVGFRYDSWGAQPRGFLVQSDNKGKGM